MYCVLTIPCMNTVGRDVLLSADCGERASARDATTAAAVAFILSVSV